MAFLYMLTWIYLLPLVVFIENNERKYKNKFNRLNRGFVFF